jgi:hypothetical protein
LEWEPTDRDWSFSDPDLLDKLSAAIMNPVDYRFAQFVLQAEAEGAAVTEMVTGTEMATGLSN